MGDISGVVVVSAGHVGGARGSGIVSSVADVLWMSVVRGMRGVGGVCEMCMRSAWGSVGGEGDECIGFGLYQPCGDMGSIGRMSVDGGICGEWVGAWTRVWRCGEVLCLCEL